MLVGRLTARVLDYIASIIRNSPRSRLYLWQALGAYHTDMGANMNEKRCSMPVLSPCQGVPAMVTYDLFLDEFLDMQLAHNLLISLENIYPRVSV